MRKYYLLLLLLVFASSCTIHKRLYRDGFYVDRKQNSAVQSPAGLHDNAAAIAVEKNVTSNFSPADLHDSCLPVIETKTAVETKKLPPDSTRRKRFRKTDSDTVPAEEEPATIETGSKRWRHAAHAVGVAFFGLILGFLILLLVFYEWLAIAIGAVLVAGTLFFIFLSMRAHHRFKKQDPLAAKQTIWGVIGRFFLYAVALAGAGVIFNAFILWSLKTL